MTNPIPITLHPHEALARAEHRLSLIIRPVEPQPLWLPGEPGVGIPDGYEWSYDPENDMPYDWTEEEMLRELPEHCPLGAPGQRLWGREDFYVQPELWEDGNAPQPWEYAANVGHPANVEDYRLITARTMPFWACRAHLVNTSVRVAMLQEVGPDEAEASGIKQRWTCLNPQIGLYGHENDVVDDFHEFWDTTYDRRGLGIEQNPWCWFVGVKEAKHE